ncbi:hypothetical protein O181_081576 [Austropuccinia psidii MF-1]|uniref:Uncharacterized protein n=1 Tax=Austropuccinia psidii MF-1 TaxID=1389203 RepID=A0A9Q3FKG8_9BASI|nr:hypothetical protein [Austropuccinia psidii MF-1]
MDESNSRSAARWAHPASEGHRCSPRDLHPQTPTLLAKLRSNSAQPKGQQQTLGLESVGDCRLGWGQKENKIHCRGVEPLTSPDHMARAQFTASLTMYETAGIKSILHLARRADPLSSITHLINSTTLLMTQSFPTCQPHSPTELTIFAYHSSL